jgi:hypothetical protein
MNIFKFCYLVCVLLSTVQIHITCIHEKNYILVRENTSRYTAVGVATTLWAGQLRKCGSIDDRCKNMFVLLLSSYSTVRGLLGRGYSGFHLVPVLSKKNGVPSLYADLQQQKLIR